MHEDVKPAMSGEEAVTMPTRQELNAELLPVPELPEQPEAVEPPGFDDMLSHALRYVKGKRGGDLVAVLLTGSAARRMLTPHSDLDLIVVVKGELERDELIRVADRVVDIRYRGQRLMEDELTYSPRLASLLRKARVLFEHEAVGANLIERAAERFRQGPERVALFEQIRLKTECLHLLGKAEDLQRKSAIAQHLLALFADRYLEAFFRLRGFWPTAPADLIRFLSSRDPAIGGLVERFQLEPTVGGKLNLGRQLADLLFRDVPLPARID
jgi:predicted nucleotidyltransferase